MENRGQNLELKIKANDKTDFGFSPKRQQALVIKGILNSSRRRGINHYNERRMYFFFPLALHILEYLYFSKYIPLTMLNNNNFIYKILNKQVQFLKSHSPSNFIEV